MQINVSYNAISCTGKLTVTAVCWRTFQSERLWGLCCNNCFSNLVFSTFDSSIYFECWMMQLWAAKALQKQNKTKKLVICACRNRWNKGTLSHQPSYQVYHPKSTVMRLLFMKTSIVNSIHVQVWKLWRHICTFAILTIRDFTGTVHSKVENWSCPCH